MVNSFYPTMPGMSGGFGGGWSTYHQLMQQWSNLGVFTVLLPLLLIFTVVFAILEKINLFRNRGVHLIIALVIGFFTISNPYVSSFFMWFFSYVGLAVIILLGLVILLGIAINPGEEAGQWIVGIGGAVLFLYVLAWSGALKMMIGDQIFYLLRMNSAVVIFALVIIGVVIAVWKGVTPELGKKKTKTLGQSQ